MTKPILVVKIFYKLLYIIQVVKRFLISNKVLGRTYLFAILLLIGLAFFTPRMFCLVKEDLPIVLQLEFQLYTTFKKFYH